MIAAIIVSGSIVFTAAMALAWLLSPGLRAWLEQPKHRFQDRLRRYDQSHLTRQ